MLPFRFQRRDNGVLLVNDVGNYIFLTSSDFNSFINGTIACTSATFLNLKTKDFLCLSYTADVVETYASKYRTKKRFLFDSTSLHMLVTTHRCNQHCKYCHASSSDIASLERDMPEEVARQCIQSAFQSPSPAIKIEFQGGEPTLNFSSIKAAVLTAEQLNQSQKKSLEFVVCSNLLSLDPDQAAFFRDHAVHISTSLDGPAVYHDSCRLDRNGDCTYERVTQNIQIAKTLLGHDRVSALLTVTKNNLQAIPVVIDEYLRQGFQSVFIRPLDPLGYASENWSDLAYGIDDFADAYLDGLDYIVELNRNGTHFIEEYATILLTKILTPFPTGFVDLQSPSGIGICGIIYETNGDVFLSDEARMFFRMNGDKRFCLGNVCKDDRNALFASSAMRDTLPASVIESLPGCAWCVYQPYCGCDPVRSHATNKSLISFKPNDPFCRLQKRIFDHLFSYLEKDDQGVIDIFWGWITGRSFSEINLEGIA